MFFIVVWKFEKHDDKKKWKHDNLILFILLILKLWHLENLEFETLKTNGFLKIWKLTSPFSFCKHIICFLILKIWLFFLFLVLNIYNLDHLNIWNFEIKNKNVFLFFLKLMKIENLKFRTHGSVTFWKFEIDLKQHLKFRKFEILKIWNCD